MTASFYGLAVALLLCGGVCAVVVSSRSDRVGLAIATWTAVPACVIGAFASGRSLLISAADVSFGGAWTLPIGSFQLGVDGLSSFFLFCIFLVSGISSIYGHGYLQAHSHKTGKSRSAAFFNLLAASMAVFVLARDGVLFIMAWEVMFLASYFLVTQENERRDVRRAGLVYLVASHFGVLFLSLLFALLVRRTDTMQFDFEAFLAAGPPSEPFAAVLFLLALIGFGLKAGMWPLHIWLPEAHPAAPSHVSAVMSGVMIKMGIYGLLRILTFLGPPPPWWGMLLIGVGIISGISGLFYALAQRDLKRLLAYSSVENVGIITIGIGLGLLGQSLGQVSISFIGYTGALLHVLSHGLFKGLLFHGAGSVLLSAGTRDMAALGGLIRRMPFTALTFAVGAVAIAALPPLNGFVSKWLLYTGALVGAASLPGVAAVAAIAIIPSFALIGGLAIAAFVKAFGIVFLGSGRTPAVDEAHEPGLAMRVSMAMGALSCVVIGVWPWGAMKLAGVPGALLAGGMAPLGAVAPFGRIAGVGAVLVTLTAGIAALQTGLLRKREIRSGPTWGCGYVAPGNRTQYTAASFSKPLLDAFPFMFIRRRRDKSPVGYFPKRARYVERLGDPATERILAPAVRRALNSLSFVRGIQSGHMQHYLAYILVTLILLLVWQMSGGGG